MSDFSIGDVVRCRGTFTDIGNTAIDPTSVYFKIKDPSGTITTYTYGSSVELIKDSTGVYYIDIRATSAGRWQYRYYSTGTGEAAEERDFFVKATNF